LVFHRGLFRQTMPTLLCTVGTIFMTVFMSVSTSVFEPFHCNLHPNGERTMSAYGQVVCWNTDYGDDHWRMLVVGCIASFVPLCFLSVCVWATITLPRKLHESDASFLRCFSFLFFRFRPGAHAFVLVLLLRNLAFALLPVITGDIIDIFALGGSVLLCVMANCLVFPWAVYQANLLDIGVHVGVLLVLFLAGLQTEPAGGRLVGNMIVAVFFAFMSGFVVSGAWCLHMWWMRLRRPFHLPLPP